MTRDEKIEALVEGEISKMFSTRYKPSANTIFKAGVLAGIKLRDEELLAMEFDEECTDLSKWIGDFDNGITVPTYGDVAHWQFEQFMKAIKGDG